MMMLPLSDSRRMHLVVDQQGWSASFQTHPRYLQQLCHRSVLTLTSHHLDLVSRLQV